MTSPRVLRPIWRAHENPRLHALHRRRGIAAGGLAPTGVSLLVDERARREVDEQPIRERD